MSVKAVNKTFQKMTDSLPTGMRKTLYEHKGEYHDYSSRHEAYLRSSTAQSDPVNGC